MMGIGIKTLRKEKGWNQTELAKKIGVGRTTVTEYERETITPPYEKIQAMAELFGVTVKYLTGEANSRTDANIADVNDVREQLTKMVDNLCNVEYQVTFDGVTMNIEKRDALAAELKQSIRLIEYMNKLNKPEQ